MACGPITPASVYTISRPLPNFTLRAPSIGFRAPPTPALPHHHSMASTKPLFPNKATSVGTPRPRVRGYGLNTSFQGMQFYPQQREKLLLFLVIDIAYTWSSLVLEVPSKSVTELVLFIYLVVPVPVITPGPLQVFLVVLRLWPLLGLCVAGFLRTWSSSSRSSRTMPFFHLPGVCCVEKAQG